MTVFSEPLAYYRSSVKHSMGNRNGRRNQIATQLTDMVEVGGGHERGAPAAISGGQPKVSEPRQEPAQSVTPATASRKEPELEQYFEAVDGTGAPVDIVYRINVGTKKLAGSTLPRNGVTQAFPLDQETELVFWKAP